jgi:hypothetical protein
MVHLHGDDKVDVVGSAVPHGGLGRREGDCDRIGCWSSASLAAGPTL